MIQAPARTLDAALVRLLGPRRPDAGPIVVAYLSVGDLQDATRRLAVLPGLTFCHVFGVDERALRSCFRVHVLWAYDPNASWLDLIVDVDGHQPGYPSLTPIVPAAGWYERALWEGLGIVPLGHPNLRRLAQPATWPAGHHLLRSDLDWTDIVASVPASEDEELAPLAPAPVGVVDYPLGPVRSGVVESGHYTLRTVGEELVNLRLQLFYKHRGVEKRAEGLSLQHAPLVAERISGTSAFAHSLALCQAVEAAAGVNVPDRARYLRSCLAELERLYNHIGFQADLCQATGLVVGQAQLEILKERLLRLNAALAGHRYLFGMNVPGGLSRDLDAGSLDLLRATLHHLGTRLDVLDPMLLGSPSHVDRLEGAGILRPEDAQMFGAVGPIGRASGIDRDLRRDHPYAAYDAVEFDVPVRPGGDAMARCRIRLDEAREAMRILAQLIERAPAGPVHAAMPPITPGATGLGWAESARGECLHWVQIGADNTIAAYRVRPASFANWQAFPPAIPGHNILTDFPVIEQSFGLSFAGADR